MPLHHHQSQHTPQMQIHGPSRPPQTDHWNPVLRDIGECTFLRLTFGFPVPSTFGGHLGTVSGRTRLASNRLPIPNITEKLFTKQ
ncbi:hypothetical protein AMTRI_Chr13g122130 [Amborella trichopoda]